MNFFSTKTGTDKMQNPINPIQFDLNTQISVSISNASVVCA